MAAVGPAATARRLLSVGDAGAALGRTLRRDYDVLRALGPFCDAARLRGAADALKDPHTATGAGGGGGDAEDATNEEDEGDDDDDDDEAPAVGRTV